MANISPPELSLPDRILKTFQQGEYSSQGREQTGVICESVGRDLIAQNATLLEATKDGELVSERNYTPSGHRFYQDLDYVIGTPTDHPQQSLTIPEKPRNDSVDEVWFALNAESLVYSVGKNWKNRGKDIHSFYLGVYDIAPLAATGCVIVLNVSNLERDPAEIINGYQEFDLATGSLAQSLDSLAIVPIRYEKDSPEETELATELIDSDDELHYSSFIETLATAIERRFQGEYQVSPENIESVLTRHESDILEFKEEVPSHADDIGKEVAALANHEGGAVILGISDDGELIGLDDIDTVEERVSGIFGNGLTSVVRNVSKARVDGKDVLIVNVQRTTSAPVDFQDKFYVRTGTTTDHLKGREIVDRYPR